MNEVERVKKICKERHISIRQLEIDCGFSNGYISHIKRGVFPSDRLMTISKYLEVPINELSDSAAQLPADYIAKTENGQEILIEPEIKEVIEGPYKDMLLSYAKKLIEIQKMDDKQ